MDSLSIISWNIRGAVDYSHRVNLRKLIQHTRPSMICLQETKCQEWSKFMKKSVWDEEDHGWISSASVGLSGGLAISWDKGRIKHHNHICSRYWILFKGSVIDSSSKFVCFNVYAPANSALKLDLWKDLDAYFWHQDPVPIVLIGDFNSIREPEDRVNCQYAKRDSGMFNKFIEDLGLIEIQGRNRFTWIGPQGKKSALYRVLVNHKWIETGQWHSSLLSRANSDHRPLWFIMKKLDWGPKSLKIFDWWFEDSSLSQLIESKWKSMEKLPFNTKIKDIKRVIKNCECEW